ncbi:hypothetical protein BU25DRAFT_414704 [Macroventuria anomochaeta]|uniref:Uncharacterized protein n=1 Tax=Macroventuria anomochaeta TaxID=301207 RepID=A0ACB6RP53_9PLEO|nr:uncharacterized protein BU25DRAFT_414704 [Macroventuria anomochaeta]KAF2622934.1 hypothetical protein BU25DRAFT_414704 [Macroventuria anomochaeta]
MIALVTTALLAASATAQLTTAMWGFSVPKFANETYTGSVVDFSVNRTTVAYTADSMTSTKTVTIGGVTYVGYTATPTVIGHTSAAFVVTCSRANQDVSATCLQSQIGAESKMSAYCQSFSSVVAQTTHEAPEWCTNSAAFSEEARSPMTISEAAMATYALVLTGGLEKLSATATSSEVEDAGQTRESTSTPTRSAAATAIGAAALFKVPALAAAGAAVAWFL